jgi:uncharacterized protein involved in exopolysaccharide biosynthesis
MALAAAALSLVASLLLPRDWVAGGSFVVSDSKPDAGAGLAGLTQKFGIDLSSGGAGYSPRFYAYLLKSKAILSEIAQLKLKPPYKKAGQSVMDALDVRGKTESIRLERAVEQLSRIITATFDQRVEVTDYSVVTDDPELSRQIAASLFEHLNEFVTLHHQSRASVEKKFVEARLVSTNKELSAAEDALAEYVIRNRGYQKAPEQTIEFTRLSRRVRELEGVLSTLTESFEKARIEEVRDSPVLSAVDEVERPALPEHRSKTKWILVAVLVVFAAWFATFFARRLLGLSTPAQPGDPTRFADIWPTLKRELRRPWTLLMREQHS